jgi:outer membrane protein assembly factor BamB
VPRAWERTKINKMQKMRSLFLVLIGMCAVFAQAQFDGPAPVSWRWLPPSGVASSGAPLVSGDTLYIGSGGRIYAVDRVSGNKIWQFPAEEQIPGSFRAAPIIANGVLIAIGDNKIVYGIDPTTGLQKWSYVMPSRAIREPVVADAFVIIEQSDNALIAIDPATGQPAWKDSSGSTTPYHIADGLLGQIGAIGSTIYYFTNSFELHALSAVSELELWPQPVRFSQLSPFVKPVVFGGLIYVTSGTFLVAVNPSPTRGIAIWQRDTGFNQISFNPAASGSGIFVVSDDGDVMAYDASSGQPTLMQKPFNIGSFPVTSPTAIETTYVDKSGKTRTNPKLIIPTTNGAINQFDPTTQSLQWSYIVRPINEGAKSSTAGGGQRPGGGGGPGGAGGGLGGRGGAGGGGGAGGQGGQGGGNQTSTLPITEVLASGPAVVVGTTLVVPEQDSSLIGFDTINGVDLTPPKVDMLFPNAGDQVSGQPPLLLYWKVRDWGSGVNESTLKVTIDGKPYEFEYHRNGDLLLRFSNEGKNHPLQDGRHDILVDVFDWMGNEAQQHFSLTIDNTLAPIVLPGTPKSGRTGGPPGGGGGGEGGGGGGEGGGGGGEGGG